VALLGCWGMPTPLAPGIGGSVGLPHHGVLTGGRSLPDRGEGYQRWRADAVRWGNPRLVQAIAQAAAAVARQRPGGAPLLVADLSGRHGGRIFRHRSHRSGRDVDFLLYVTTPDGRSVESPGFVHFGPDGLALTAKGRWVRLDVERQWLLIKALVSSPTAHIQWLFVARWLEALLIEYAQARGEDDELVYHAAKVLRQPSDSANHDDHIHARIACSPAEAVAGCLGGGYYWSWLPPLPDLPDLPDEELLAALLDDDGGSSRAEPAEARAQATGGASSAGGGGSAEGASL